MIHAKIEKFVEIWLESDDGGGDDEGDYGEDDNDDGAFNGGSELQPGRGNIGTSRSSFFDIESLLKLLSGSLNKENLIPLLLSE